MMGLIHNICLVYKNWSEAKIQNIRSAFPVKNKIEKHYVDLRKNISVIIKDVFTGEELGVTEFADTVGYGVQIIEGITYIKRCNRQWKEVEYSVDGGIKVYVICYIPYTNIIEFDINSSNERGTYIFWCKFNNFTKFCGRNPYTKISYCEQKGKSNNPKQYGYFYNEVASFNDLHNCYVRTKNYLKSITNFLKQFK